MNLHLIMSASLPFRGHHHARQLLTAAPLMHAPSHPNWMTIHVRSLVQCSDALPPDPLD